MNGIPYEERYQCYPGYFGPSIPGCFRRHSHYYSYPLAENIPLKPYRIYAPTYHPLHSLTAAEAGTGTAVSSGEHTDVFGMTPDEWIKYTEYLVNEGLEDVKRGINATHILQEFILMGVLVGKGYTPESAYETVEKWEQTGVSKILQQSKNLQ